jgi:Flp pilus assembly pilin Flp
MKKAAALLKNLWDDESGQGATEYILLLVVVVTLALMFRNNIEQTVRAKLEELGSGIGSFGINQ